MTLEENKKEIALELKTAIEDGWFWYEALEELAVSYKEHKQNIETYFFKAYLTRPSCYYMKIYGEAQEKAEFKRYLRGRLDTAKAKAQSEAYFSDRQ